jgi:hypothetical protein
MTKKTNQQSTKQRRQSGGPKAGDESPQPLALDKEAAGPAGGSSSIPVVGIGGSAGSLEAFKKFWLLR